jgi:hypothetical protein
VKSDPTFIALREEVLSLIHHREPSAPNAPPARHGHATQEAAHG